jgi:hypothetical protein
MISLTGHEAAYSNHVGRGKLMGEAIGTSNIVRTAGHGDERRERERFRTSEGTPFR